MTNEEKLAMFEEKKTIINSKFNIEKLENNKYRLFFETDMRGRTNYRVFELSDILEIEYREANNYAYIHWQYLK